MRRYDARAIYAYKNEKTRALCLTLAVRLPSMARGDRGVILTLLGVRYRRRFGRSIEAAAIPRDHLQDMADATRRRAGGDWARAREGIGEEETHSCGCGSEREERASDACPGGRREIPAASQYGAAQSRGRGRGRRGERGAADRPRIAESPRAARLERRAEAASQSMAGVSGTGAGTSPAFHSMVRLGEICRGARAASRSSG